MRQFNRNKRNNRSQVCVPDSSILEQTGFVRPHLFALYAQCAQTVTDIRSARKSGSSNRYRNTQALDIFYKKGIGDLPTPMLVNVLRELALLHFLEPELVGRMAKILEPRIPSMGTNEAAESLRAFGLLHFMDDELYNKLEGRLIHLHRNADPVLGLNDRAASLCALGLGEAFRHESKLIDCIIDHCISRGDKFDKGRINRVIWGLSPLITSEQMSSVWPLTENLRDFNCGVEGCRLLSISGLYHGQPLDFIPRWQRVYRGEAPSGRELNHFERGVFNALRSMGIETERQMVVSGMSVDFLSKVRIRGVEKIVAIFCDGVRYHHLGYHLSGMQCGTDQLYDALLRQLGYGVVRIKDGEWPRLDAGKQRKMLTGKMEKVIRE